KKDTKESKAPEIAIDLLVLKVGKVVYKDYSGKGDPLVKEFKININEKFENITDPQSLARLILQRCLLKTTIANLTGFDLDALKGQASEVISGATEAAKKSADQAKEAAKEAADKAKKELEGATEGVKELLKF
ncbi:MAG: hypothetical protein JW867_05815, partial [Candidatus Omnitrophica bacterium]|nr:hypothetical protein [Candidatus Omnitrophota bacterium]